MTVKVCVPEDFVGPLPKGYERVSADLMTAFKRLCAACAANCRSGSGDGYSAPCTAMPDPTARSARDCHTKMSRLGRMAAYQGMITIYS